MALDYNRPLPVVDHRLVHTTSIKFLKPDVEIGLRSGSMHRYVVYVRSIHVSVRSIHVK